MTGDEDRLSAGPVRATRLLGPFDLFLQARDRPLLVEDAVRAKALWPVLGRPGAVLHNGAIIGTWRPRKSSKGLRVAIDLWATVSKRVTAAITAQAERLADHRGVRLAGIDFAG